MYLGIFLKIFVEKKPHLINIVKSISQFHPPPTSELLDLYIGLKFADGYKSFRNALKKEIFITQSLFNYIDVLYFIINYLPDFVRKMLNLMAKQFSKDAGIYST